MSTRSDLSQLADSVVTTNQDPDGTRVADPTEAEVEVLKMLLDRHVHETKILNLRTRAS